MEEKYIFLTVAIILYTIVVYLFSRLGHKREIGFSRLFLISFFLTPLMGLAFYLSSQELKINLYTELSYKCSRCGYVFSEDYGHCPFCKKEGHLERLTEVNKLMT
jgi:uncharacterized paraquat-inducible protein A